MILMDLLKVPYRAVTYSLSRILDSVLYRSVYLNKGGLSRQISHLETHVGYLETRIGGANVGGPPSIFGIGDYYALALQSGDVLFVDRIGSDVLAKALPGGEVHSAAGDLAEISRRFDARRVVFCDLKDSVLLQLFAARTPAECVIQVLDGGCRLEPVFWRFLQEQLVLSGLRLQVLSGGEATPSESCDDVLSLNPSIDIFVFDAPSPAEIFRVMTEHSERYRGGSLFLFVSNPSQPYNKFELRGVIDALRRESHFFFAFDRAGACFSDASSATIAQIWACGPYEEAAGLNRQAMFTRA